MASLKKLRCLYLSHGDLRGPIPEWLGELTQLSSLLLRHNSFSGVLPRLSNLTQLQHFWFDTQSSHDGPLTGAVDWIAKLPYLRTLHMEYNALSGPLPPALCAIECYGYGNKFSCPLPSAGCCKIDACPGGAGATPAATTPAPPPNVCRAIHQQ